MKKIVLVIAASIVGLAILGVIMFVGSYNNLVGMDEGVSSSWADVETAYQRRADLIPNLVNTVKGYAEFEQETLTQVIEARSKATSVNIDANNLSPEAISKFQSAQDRRRMLKIWESEIKPNGIDCYELTIINLD